MMFILLLVVIGVIVYFVYQNQGGGGSSGFRLGRKDDPLEIARQRYARGEITSEEYDQIRRDLMNM